MSESPHAHFASFYRATIGSLRRYLARLLGNRTEAQDLAHDAYARVYRAMDAQRIERPQAFLFTTARRLAISQLRRRQVTPVREGEGQIIELRMSEAPGVERVVMAREEWARFETAVADLPPGCRQVLQLCHDENRSHAEVGARLGIAVSTVEKQHARALRLLRKALQDDAAARDNREQESGRAAGG
jgi:RNA polymerase sigma-70 factor (ECF subfamily)